MRPMIVTMLALRTEPLTELLWLSVDSLVLLEK